MTREEAVNELNDRIKLAEYVDSDYIDCVSVDAVKMAISALSVPETNVGDTISRQAAIERIVHIRPSTPKQSDYSRGIDIGLAMAMLAIKGQPSAQPERDIPIKPKVTTDRTWVIPIRQAICPKCDYYLSNVVFIGDGKGKRVTYCEHCGQAIDWEGWDVDERFD